MWKIVEYSITMRGNIRVRKTRYFVKEKRFKKALCKAQDLVSHRSGRFFFKAYKCPEPDWSLIAQCYPREMP